MVCTFHKGMNAAGAVVRCEWES